MMKKILLVFLATLAVCSWPPQAMAGQEEEARVADAVMVINEMARVPEQSIPPRLLRNAKAVAVIPSVVKAGFIVGGRFGRGVLLLKKKNGWGNPYLITFSGGSVGWQIGVQATDVILVFRTSRSVDVIRRGRFTLGGDIAVAAGPVGRQSEAATDATMRAGILSFSRSRGLFAGVSLEGSALQVDYGATSRYYGRKIHGLNDTSGPAPSSAARLKAAISRLASLPVRRRPRPTRPRNR